MICWVLGLLVMPTVGALCWMLPKVSVPWAMYRVLLPPVLPTVRVPPLMHRVLPLARVL